MPVKLRSKTLSGGKKSYYLDIYHNGERHYEFLKIYLEKGDKDLKEKKMLAERIRAKRELEIQSEDFDFVPKHRKNIDFISFYQNFIDNYHNKDKRLV